ncbi:hypothetical protein [Novosphingobium pentaromativorans]|uniref:Uncharacterized protein n=1 Tax=Novosphingobium pentaromativorans US6-1 TaxID=1088721 RepID=G6E949_9SPHN|nr:hypothetical protein [Novosphingobium pentaromativorans]AIT81131.1 hypothetical protein JI59_15740 [Novosphingobium pentaromativorans US6-1]EHJ62273.1 hypothetical protein NSU_0870 [Novosphingobium pentaromativorans US6-1]
MISVALFAISTLANPGASCTPAALACVEPAPAAQAYPQRPFLRAKGVIGMSRTDTSETKGNEQATLSCAAHPTKNPACRHRMVKEQGEALLSDFALETAREETAQ